MSKLLADITALSHEFGTTRYVRGGGGNTSVKDETTLWVKPSGTTLAGIEEGNFVALQRARIEDLYAVECPQASSAREALVKEMMEKALCEGTAGRPSVEAPLHNCLDATYVVHTHPALVGGLVCSACGEDACSRLFPDALWVDFVDPGYTLCIHVRKMIQAFKEKNGHEPQMIILKNHGVFIAGNTPEEIRTGYSQLMTTLEEVYAKKGVAQELSYGEVGALSAAEAILKETLGSDASVIETAPPFPVAAGPLTPDHIVYMKAQVLREPLTTENLQAYFDKHGYWPRIIVTQAGVLAPGGSAKAAGLAMELAKDGALVEQLTAAFGGVEYMTDQAVDFIENWEVENYRRKQAGV